MLPLTRFRKRTRFFGISGPSLAFDFANNGPFDPRITFTRASSATLFDSSGTLVYAPMNLLLQSEDFTTTWVTGRSNISPDVAIAPDGATTADALIEDNTAANTHNVGQGFSFTAGLTYTISVFAKATASPRFLQIIFPSAAFGATRRPVFDLVNGTAAAATDTTASIENVGDGWYRCIASMQAASTNSASLQFQLAETYTNSNSLYDGDGTSGIYIWGAQLNIANMQGGVTGDLSTYYPTTTAAYQGPRLDYDPATLLPRGFLVEEQRTNLLRYSEAFDTTPNWNPTRTSVTANAAVSPDGNTTADALVIDTTPSTNHNIGQNASVTSGTTYTISVFAKANQITQINLRFNAQFPAGNTFFDLSAGTLANNGTVVASSITPVGNGWYCCTFTQTANATGTAAVQIFLAQANAITIATANGTDNVLIWGAQLEVGAFPTSYIPTTTTALTRSADVASVNTLSPWYRADEGTLFAEWDMYAFNAGLNYRASFNDGTTSNALRMRLTPSGTTSVRHDVVNGGVATALGSPTTVNLALTKEAMAFASNDYAGVINAGAVSTSGTLTLPTATQLSLGSRETGISQLNGHLRRITYYPRKLSSAELQAITA